MFRSSKYFSVYQKFSQNYFKLDVCFKNECEWAISLSWIFSSEVEPQINIYDGSCVYNQWKDFQR